MRRPSSSSITPPLVGSIVARVGGRSRSTSTTTGTVDAIAAGELLASGRDADAFDAGSGRLLRRTRRWGLTGDAGHDPDPRARRRVAGRLQQVLRHRFVQAFLGAADAPGQAGQAGGAAQALPAVVAWKLADRSLRASKADATRALLASTGRPPASGDPD